MKKTLIKNLLVLAVLFFAGCATPTPNPAKPLSELTVSSSVHQNAALAFISHRGSTSFSNYLSMEVNYTPVKALFENLQKTEGLILKNRGEAHVTVITPPEYDQILSQHIKMSDIEKIAIREGLQKSKLQLKCVGMGQKVLDGKTEKTYYILVVSEDLLRIRRAIQKEFAFKGGGAAFDSERFYPHITLGFTARDLHESDGVIKDSSTCVYDIVVQN